MRIRSAVWGCVIALLTTLAAHDVWACQKFRDFVPVSLIAPPNYATVISGAAVTVNLATTSTAATIYSDSVCASTKTNPMTSASDGSFEFYAEDGWYDFTFTKSGYVIQGVANVAIFTPLGNGIKTPAEFVSSTDICATGTGAIDATGSTTRTLWINSAVACTATKTVPATLSLVCVGQGSISVSNTKILTVNGPVNNLTDHACLTGAGTVTYGSTATGDPYGKNGESAVTYSASMTPTRNTGETQTIVATNNTAFTINAPTPASVPIGTPLCVGISNTSGGALGVATWNAVFKMAAWTQPATGFKRSICFRWNGTNYIEYSRTTADVPN